MNLRCSGARLGATLVMAVVIGAAIAGCGGGGASTGKSDQPAQPGGVLHIAQFAEPETLNPPENISFGGLFIGPQINETLFKYSEAGKFVPLLATGYKRAADDKTWTIDLRHGVRFSNGEPMTAADVVFTINQVHKSPYYEALWEEIASVRATSSYQIQIRTKHPFPGMIANLTSYAGGVVPNHWGGLSKKEFAQAPIGTGPFELKKWGHGTGVTLAKNPHYWQKSIPLVDEIVLPFVPDANSRAIQFRNHELDIVTQPPLSQLASLEQEGAKVPPNSKNGTLADYISFSLKSAPFSDRRAREAVNLAINRQSIVDAALHGFGEPASSFLIPSLPYFDKSMPVVSQSLDQAKKLVQEVKSSGISTNFTLSYPNTSEYFASAAQVIQQSLSEAGFQVTLNPLEEGALGEEVAAGKLQASLLELGPGVPDPAETIETYFAYFGRPSGANTAPIEAVAQEAQREIDPAKRQGLYDRVQEMVGKELQIVSVDYQPFIVLNQQDVSGIEVNPIAPASATFLNRAGFTH